MSGQPVHIRTVVEIALIAIVIYILLGTPGLQLSSFTGIASRSSHGEVPGAHTPLETLVYPSRDLQCPQHDYNVHVFSTSPLILYIDGFLHEREADHLIASR